uniref:Putative calcineurin-like phosphoesterase n=1 Tax=viral metagenome TaxID=1070528 RepID=A0A6M3IW46_9ZZZZ
MRVLCTSDWHIRKKRPKNRLDENYFGTIKSKIKQIFKIAEDTKCEAILQPGDMFDDFDLSHETIRETIKLLNESPCIIITIPGQHDLKYHSKVWTNSPIGIADVGTKVQVIPKGVVTHIENISIQGSAFGEDIPEPYNEEAFKILICHKMIIPDPIPFDYDYTMEEMLEFGYDLVVSGDNHKSFYYYKDNKHLFNCGSLMRTRIDQSDHFPCVVVFDTDALVYNKIDLEVEPFNSVMDVEKAEEEEKKNEHLEAFIAKIEAGVDEEEETNFRKLFVHEMETKKKELGEDVISVLKEVMII